MPRRTKIVATLGPASSEGKVLARMIDAGLDVVRLNFSHGAAAEHRRLAELVRSLARKADRAVGVLVDLQGPKIRIGRFREGKITLAPGAKFILDAECKLGDALHVGLDYKNLPNDVRPGDTLLLDDGRIVLGVASVRGPRIGCIVEQGGVLSNNKGINRKGGGLTAPALTEKDMADIRTAAAIKADFLGVSFPRSGADIKWARDLMQKAGGRSLIVAKIERAEAIPALEEILDASDGVMVARGDLAVEVGDAVVPALQKRMIRMARERNKFTITATQMMESMISNPIPTRAEVSDVANAVLDGTDAVMLSAETATGQYPVETVAAMARVCVEAEKEDTLAGERRHAQPPASVEEAIARATVFTANSLNIKAVAAMTQSGKTVLLMSRMYSNVPLYAMSSVIETRRRVTLFRGVYPIKFRGARNPERALTMAEDELLKRGAVRSGDYIVLTIGEPFGKAGGTNTMKIVKVGEHRHA
ncbi:MAG: pyruvate kinase [Betaproteobacteria bacterium RIFCSPLOWO2_02_64_14]|nr:MAG: pyruvate kinase [Betaproteobacteria bacterium RIFCSPLOWO2_02_64_14]